MTDIDKIREAIDKTDTELIDLLARRFSFSEMIGEIKRAEGIPVIQSERFDQLKTSRKEHARKAGLTEEFTEEFLNLIHRESVRIQQGSRKEE
ncbi:MAG: hypothetical protein EA408_09120 [Marinilabiliales bacterium]|nr:MAG: hypothetical protein EA408_09120 [Marinilabiliales bacterium]